MALMLMLVLLLIRRQKQKSKARTTKANSSWCKTTTELNLQKIAKCYILSNLANSYTSKASFPCQKFSRIEKTAASLLPIYSEPCQTVRKNLDPDHLAFKINKIYQSIVTDELQFQKSFYLQYCIPGNGFCHFIVHKNSEIL